MNASGQTVGDGSSSESEGLYRRLLLPSYIISLCVSLVALLSLVFTLWIFARKRDATAGARGMVLLIVTGLLTAFALTVLYVSSICSLTAPLSDRAAKNLTAPASPSSKSLASLTAMELFSDAQYIVTNASLLLRNWWVTFLTGIRFIVILFPLHVPEILTKRRQSVAFCLILCLSAAISVVRHVEEKACNARAEEAAAANLTTQASKKDCERFIVFFFVMQTGIPVPAVLVLSVALAIHLCAAREPSDVAVASASNCVRRSDSTVSSNIVSTTSVGAVASVAAWKQQQQQQQQQPIQNHRPSQVHRPSQQVSTTVAKNRSRGRKRKATRILLVLAATFTVLELPTFVFFIMLHFFPSFRTASVGKSQLIFSCFNALITLDTLANFFIFFVFSDSFKREVKSFVRRALRQVRCCRRHVEGQRFTCNSVNGAAEITVAGGGASSPQATPEMYPLAEDLQPL